VNLKVKATTGPHGRQKGLGPLRVLPRDVYAGTHVPA
jgi:hypothetical protein